MSFLKISSAVLALAIVSQSQAITILGTFVPGGGNLPGGDATLGAPAMSGGGNLTAIFNAAASMWEQAIGDSHVVTISYGWTSLSGGILGEHSLLSEGGVPHRETGAQIAFDGDGSSSFFADSTPFDHSEYTNFSATTQDFGGGVMNKGRYYTGATGAAVGNTDLFSVALHEIGHALGLSSANNAFVAENGDFDIDVMGPRLFAGSVFETRNGAHLDIDTTSMWPFIASGERKLLSDVDIIANMQISQFTQFGPVPEPATMTVLGLGALALIRKRKNSKK